MVRGHFPTYTIAKKMLIAIYWWPTLFKDTHEFYRSYDSCQKIGGLKTKKYGQVGNNTSKGTFMKWGLDLIYPIKLAGRLTRNIYILVVLDYATKWAEAKAFRTNTIIITSKFMHKYILTRFGCPLTIVIYQGIHFINDIIIYLIE